MQLQKLATEKWNTKISNQHWQSLTQCFEMQGMHILFKLIKNDMKQSKEYLAKELPFIFNAIHDHTYIDHPCILNYIDE